MRSTLERLIIFSSRKCEKDKILFSCCNSSNYWENYLSRTVEDVWPHWL